MKYNIQDYVGKKLGRLTVVSDEPFKDNRNRTMYKCVCECGTELYRYLSDIASSRKNCCRNCVTMGRHSARTRKVVVRNLDGEIIERYSSISRCSEIYGAFPASVSYWIRNKIIMHERTFHYSDEPFNKAEYKAEPPKKKSSKKRIANHVINYKTMHKVICVTPCPFSDEPDPDKRFKVGSSNCVSCQYFISKNPRKHTVSCSFNKGGIKGLVQNKLT